MASTFGEFFENLRRRIERTGRTDSACDYMDRYKDAHCTSRVIHFGREDPGWKVLAGQELSYTNLFDFCAAMTKEGLRDLTEKYNSDAFLPETFGWALDSMHEFHHAIFEEAQGCGLQVDHLSSWCEVREKRRPLKSTAS